MNEELKIEKNIPFPEKTNKYKELFDKMEVGDSFFISNGELYRSVGSSARNYEKIEKKKFALRKLKDNGFRCWRVK